MQSRQVAILAIAGLLAAAHVAAEEVASATVSVNAQFAPRTSLKVSSELLQFSVSESGQPATVAIEFTAGARTRANDDIVLSVEPLQGIDGPGGAADVDVALSVAGEGDAFAGAGTILSTQTTVVGRWQGSGLRRGRLVFTLRADAAGTYSMPVRFVLSTP